jgi:uncharacterized protein with GYD domain
MPKFAIFFTYNGDSIAAMLEHPTDRQAEARRAVESIGGRLDAYYWMFGPHDGLAIVDAPDSATAGAVSLAVGSSGGFSRLETHELIEPGALAALLQKAKHARANYRAPSE